MRYLPARSFFASGESAGAPVWPMMSPRSPASLSTVSRLKNVRKRRKRKDSRHCSRTMRKQGYDGDVSAHMSRGTMTGSVLVQTKKCARAPAGIVHKHQRAPHAVASSHRASKQTHLDIAALLLTCGVKWRRAESFEFRPVEFNTPINRQLCVFSPGDATDSRRRWCTSHR